MDKQVLTFGKKAQNASKLVEHLYQKLIKKLKNRHVKVDKDRGRTRSK